MAQLWEDSRTFTGSRRRLPSAWKYGPGRTRRIHGVWKVFNTQRLGNMLNEVMWEHERWLKDFAGNVIQGGHGTEEKSWRNIIKQNELRIAWEVKDTLVFFFTTWDSCFLFVFFVTATWRLIFFLSCYHVNVFCTLFITTRRSSFVCYDMRVRFSSSRHDQVLFVATWRSNL